MGRSIDGTGTWFEFTVSVAGLLRMFPVGDVTRTRNTAPLSDGWTLLIENVDDVAPAMFTLLRVHW